MNTVTNYNEIALEAIMKQKDVYRAAFDLSDMAQAVISPGLEFLRANAEFCRVTGYSEADLLGLSVLDIVHPMYRTEAGLRLDADAVITVHFIHKNGSLRQGRFHHHLVEDDASMLFCIILVIEEITQPGIPPEASRLYDGLYRHVIDESTDSIAFLERDGRVLFMNGAGLAGLGASGAHAAVRCHYADLWDGTNSLAARAAVHLARNGIVGRFDAFSSAYGGPRWWEVRVVPIDDREQGLSMILAISRETTAQKREEQLRQELEKRLKSEAPGLGE